MLKFSLNLVLSPIIVHQLFFPKLNFAEHEISLMVSLIVVPLFPAQIFKYNGTRVEIFLCTFRKHIFSQNFYGPFFGHVTSPIIHDTFFSIPVCREMCQVKRSEFSRVLYQYLPQSDRLSPNCQKQCISP